MKDKKIVIYKDFGKMYATNLENYNNKIMNKNECTLLEDFPTIESAKEYFITMCNYKEENILTIE